jgi:alpha-galactosidase/6-phospho-beta-glucosidase family protein
MAVKVTMIGGGAPACPPLLRKFIESEELGGSQLTLMDVDAGRLETMVAGRQADRVGVEPA